MSVELKIKSKHLALEPAIIRKEEQKLDKQIKHYKSYHQITKDGDTWSFSKDHPDLYNLCLKRGSLICHRKWNVRNEARATYLARAYLKGVPYKVVEANCKEKLWSPVMDSLIRMVMKYGNTYYRPDRKLDENGHRSIVVKTAEKKAEDDILAWLNKE
jgi:hypothetical protein